VIPYGTTLGSVGELHRYPVKSLAGERRTSLEVDARGVVGDRLWAVLDHDGKLGSGKSSRRFRKMEGLLALEARYDEERHDEEPPGDVPVVTFPDGRRVRADDPGVHEALSEYVGRPVTLAREASVPHFDEGPLHLVTTASLGVVAAAQGHPIDARRTRANIVVDTGDLPALPEDALDGRRLAIGAEVVVQVSYAMPRCVMVDLALVDQPAAPGVLRTLTRLTGGELGVVADVVRGGTVSVGDPVTVTP
jgi:uncharacterized protein YcbX